MKKLVNLLALSVTGFCFSQSDVYIQAYKTAFADALCYKIENSCERRVPYTEYVNAPTNDQGYNYSSGYINGLLSGFKHRNSENNTNYNYYGWMEEIIEKKNRKTTYNRRQAASDAYGEALDDILRARNPRPSDPEAAAIYDAIMSNDLEYTKRRP